MLDAVDNNATKALQTLLDHAKAIIDSKEYAGAGITYVEEAYAAVADYYTLDDNGNPVAVSGLKRANLCPVIADLHHAVSEALLRMDALPKEQN